MISDVFTVTALYSGIYVVILAAFAPKVAEGHLRTKRQTTMIDDGLSTIRQVVGSFGKFEIVNRALAVDDEQDQIILEHEVRMRNLLRCHFSQNVSDTMIDCIDNKQLGGSFSLSYEMPYVYSLSMSMPEV